MKILFMSTGIVRKLQQNVIAHLSRGKSILLLGPRQTGKTTLINEQIQADIHYSFAKIQTRQRYERDPGLLEQELETRIRQYPKPPVVFIDEVQKIPAIMDSVQYLIDSKQAQFILTGSSARQLKQGRHLNLLPGRVVALKMPPLLFDELPDPKPALEELLLYGSLPGIITETNNKNRETDLHSYVQAYLEEEVRAEAIVRNIGSFSRFLEIAAGESGRQLNFTKLSQDIGVADSTIMNYYQILQDCLITLRVDPITTSTSKRRLVKSPKYLFFDLGIRRACANEGLRLPQAVLGHLFEHYVGNELIYQSALISPQIKIRYWRDLAGPEVDFVIDVAKNYIPVEVKWSEQPKMADARHLKKFIAEYPGTEGGYVVCRTPHRYHITDNIIALPWQELDFITQH